MQISIIGSGNVATHLGRAFFKSGHRIIEIASRSKENAERLSEQLHARALDSISQIDPSVDLIVISASDAAMGDIVAQLPDTQAIVVHTAGSIPMSVLDRFNNHGVIYPLQTLSRLKDVDLSNVPFLIEGNNQPTLNVIGEITRSISGNVSEGSSEQRQHLHLAAVFACNFTNHLYAIADRLLQQQGMSIKMLLPLINETTHKIETLSPYESQTGPAIRRDSNVMEKHLNALRDTPEIEVIYRMLSKNIIEFHEIIKK